MYYWSPPVFGRVNVVRFRAGLLRLLRLEVHRGLHLTGSFTSTEGLLGCKKVKLDSDDSQYTIPPHTYVSKHFLLLCLSASILSFVSTAHQALALLYVKATFTTLGRDVVMIDVGDRRCWRALVQVLDEFLQLVGTALSLALNLHMISTNKIVRPQAVGGSVD